MEGDIIKTKTL